MKRMKLRLAVAIVAVSLGSLASAAVFVVDDNGGAGVTHTQIAAAVASASDGDLVLVRSGTYASFTIDGKTLTVLADDGAIVTVTNYAAVSNVAAGQRVLLRGLRVAAPAETFYSASPPPEIDGCVRLTNDAGIVQVEDCVLTGSVACVRAVSAKANLVRVTATAGPAYMLGLSFQQAGRGIDATSSSLAIDRSSFTGGFGYNTTNGNGNGGAGAAFTQSSVYAVGTTFKGGKGTDAGYIGLGLCMNGGNGGPGVLASGGSTLLRTAACTLAGGPGGAASPPMPIVCPGGAGGPPVQDFAGATLVDTGLAVPRGVTVTAPKRVGQTVKLTFQGVQGDLVFLFWGATPQQSAYPIYDHSLLALPSVVVALGAMPGPTWDVPATMGPIGGGALFNVVYSQVAMVDALGNVVLGGPSTIIALDPSL